MTGCPSVVVLPDRLEEFRLRHGMRRLGLLGMTPVRTAPSRMMGRRVNLNTPGLLNPSLQEQVVSEARLLYAGG